MASRRTRPGNCRHPCGSGSPTLIPLQQYERTGFPLYQLAVCLVDCHSGSPSISIARQFDHLSNDASQPRLQPPVADFPLRIAHQRGHSCQHGQRVIEADDIAVQSLKLRFRARTGPDALEHAPDAPADQGHRTQRSARPRQSLMPTAWLALVLMPNESANLCAEDLGIGKHGRGRLCASRNGDAPNTAF